jgi:hypothetical protein
LSEPELETMRDEIETQLDPVDRKNAMHTKDKAK